MIDLNNSTKWQLLITQEFRAKFLTETRFYSMSEQPINVLGESGILAVLVQIHENHPSTWFYAGQLNQYLRVNILDANTINTASIKSFPLKLNQLNLVIPDRSLVNNYALTYKPAKWFFYAKLTVWEYVDNSLIDANNRLENIENLLLDVGTTVETINTNIIKSKDLYGLP